MAGREREHASSSGIILRGQNENEVCQEAPGPSVPFTEHVYECSKKNVWPRSHAWTENDHESRKTNPKINTPNENLETLLGYVDADWANCTIDGRSYTGYVIKLSKSPISWESRKQRTAALSSTEAEYTALTEAAKEAVYFRRFLTELGFVKLADVKIFSDNHGAQRLADNPIFHSRSEHIDVRHHFVREVLEEGLMKIEYKSTY